MNILAEIKSHFKPVLDSYGSDKDLLSLIRPSTKDGVDYQANCAMPLSKEVKKPPVELANEIVSKLQLDAICDSIEVAGPGFINLSLNDQWLSKQLVAACKDEKLGVQATNLPQTVVIDYSSPNVAKPMHVGHIRSTAIGDALAKVYKFLGHNVITDNHVGDWGTQFGMIIFGYRNLLDEKAFEADPIPELLRLYRLVKKVSEYQKAIGNIDELKQQLEKVKSELTSLDEKSESADKSEKKKLKKQRSVLTKRIDKVSEEIESSDKLIASVESAPATKQISDDYPEVYKIVLGETAKLHEGDEENLRLWKEFYPYCQDEMQRVYDRLDVEFDHTLGESFYHNMLADTVASLDEKGLIKESQGAKCVFMDEFDTPMIVQKSDGAYLYSTTDLATIKYRVDEWNPDQILYVVDHRQSEHFDKLFAAAKNWGFDATCEHVKFGTVMGKDGKPFKTSSGDTVGLMGLVDEAVSNAYRVVCESDDKNKDPQLSEEDRRSVSEVVGIGSLKYFDLKHNRASDYTFDDKEMLSLNGNTAVVLQYAYARVQGIFRKADAEIQAIREAIGSVSLETAKDRKLALLILKFDEALQDVIADNKPNILCEYVYDLAKSYQSFFEACPVLKAETDELRNSRLILCDLTARVIQKSLELLGIKVVPRM